MTKRVLLFFFFGLFLLNARIVFASTCSTYGNTSYCSDGTTYSTYGNTTYGSDGTTYSTYGNSTYVKGQNGYTGTANTYGNSTYYTGSAGDNYTANTYGNSTYITGSNGTNGIINTYGNTSYGSGNAFNTCPANSAYNSSTGKCSCNYGYSVDSSKTSCVYVGTTPTTLTCPQNSYSNGAACTCNYGYMASGGSCITYNQSCQNQYGYNSYGNSTSCYCSAGYQWNAARTSCVATPSLTCASGSVYKNGQCISNTADCELSFGSNVIGVPGANNNSSCNCASGYQWNSLKTACQVIPMPPAITNNSSAVTVGFTTMLQVGSSGAQVTLLQTLLTKLGDFSGDITGYYGSATKAAVIAYQTSRNISPTGTVGPQTRALLNSYLGTN